MVPPSPRPPAWSTSSAWPAGTRLILRRERPHPGGQLPDLELRHRRHARVEDRIRNAKDTGMRNLPFHDLAQNRVWLAITALATDLLAWTQRLALTAASYEPKRLRLRIRAVAGRLVRTGRRQLLHIDPAWPWAHQIATAHARLAAFAAP
jgi:hypothetical protein